MATAVSSAPDLFAAALGLPRDGPGRCCYCAAPASEAHAPPDSYTALDALAAPGSGRRCAGCAAAMTATAGQSPDGKPWMWSWVISPTRADRHALCPMLGGDRVRAGRAAMLSACLAPPEPPYVLLLNAAGRTHTLYRAAVHRGPGRATLNLDGRPVCYTAAQLARAVELCRRVAAGWGVKTARDRLPVPPERWSAGTLDLAERWEEARGLPLVAAAALLFPDPEAP